MREGWLKVASAGLYTSRWILEMTPPSQPGFAFARPLPRCLHSPLTRTGTLSYKFPTGLSSRWEEFLWFSRLATEYYSSSSHSFFRKIWGSTYSQTLEVRRWPRPDHGISYAPGHSDSFLETSMGLKLGQSSEFQECWMNLLGGRKSFCWISKRSSFTLSAAIGCLWIREGRVVQRMKLTEMKPKMERSCPDDHLNPLTSPRLKPSPLQLASYVSQYGSFLV